MRLVRYGTFPERPGLLDGDTLRDLSDVVSDIDSGVLANEFAQIEDIDPSSLPAVPEGQRLGPPVSDTSKLIGVGLNYRDHAREAGVETPAEPTLFSKATSAICGANDNIWVPPGAEQLDWEVELGVVIGTECREVSENRATDYIAGYCVVNDISERSYQLQRGGQWMKGKSADTFAPVGPQLVTRNEVSDPLQLDLWLTVNGETRQRGTTSEMVFPPAYLVAYISQFMTLRPGDIIATGTPSGVGFTRDPPEFLQPSDVLRLGITGLGEQSQRVVSATVE